MTSADIPAIYQLGIHAYAESAYNVFDYNEERVTQVFNFIISLDEGFGIVLECEGAITGYLLAAKEQMFFGNDEASYDITFYIKPEYRGSFGAIKMLKKYTAWSRDSGCAVCCLNMATMVNHERTSKFYEKMGFEFIGTQHRMVF
jgi:GNAT superfamily N-acetyltransferase